MAKIKSTMFGLALAGLTTATAGAAPFALDAGRTEVLLDPSAPKATHLAADELSALLGRVFDRPVPIVTAPTPGRTAIVLGTNAWSRAAGLAPERLPRDSFQLRVAGARLYIAGCDATATDPESQNYLGEECLWQPQVIRSPIRQEGAQPDCSAHRIQCTGKLILSLLFFPGFDFILQFVINLFG